MPPAKKEEELPFFLVMTTKNCSSFSFYRPFLSLWTSFWVATQKSSSMRWKEVKVQFLLNELNFSCSRSYSLVFNTSHGVFLENCDRANFCMVITLLIFNRSWWDFEGCFQLALKRCTINIIMIDKDIAEWWPFKVRHVSYSSVSCIRDQRVAVDYPWSLSLFVGAI